MMKENNLQKKYSLRKFKGIGLASAVIGMFLANQSVYANVTADGKEETTIVTDLERVPSSAKTTFTDDQNPTKKVTVDAVIGNVNRFPKKVNEYLGVPDGTDRVKFSRKATVNYLLEKDGSKITESKIYEEKGNVYTNYHKKGLSYDTDGKAYEGAGIERAGDEINKDTGSKFYLEANNKKYQLVRSEVIDEDKAIYEKTHFNDIEASVSPEGMHKYLGEINYGKFTGKVYLVEETSDGHYGKFVEATNINSDEEAVNAWKNGQATAKDFTKENVTLKEGDTVLVMDRDTYALGNGGRKVHRTDYRREKVAATPEYNKLASSEEISNVNGYPTYAFDDEILNDKFSTIGKDGVFGTSDDGEVEFKNESHLRYERNSKLGNYFSEMTDIPDVDFRKMSVNEILRYMQSEVYGVLEYFDHYAKTDADRQEIQERRSRLDQNIADTAEMIKNENIDIAAQSWRLAFLSPDKEKLTNLRKHIESGEKVLDELTLTLKTDEENVDQYENQKDVKKITKKILLYELNHKDIYGYHYGYPKFSYRTVVSYHKDAEPEHYSDWKKDDEREEREVFVNANKGVVTISDDLNHINVIDENKTTTETEFTKQEVTTTKETDYEVKELITPVRAYKVMGDGSPIVNHYYRIQITRESEAYSMKAVGGVRIKYLTTEGEELKTEIVREVGDIYELNVYNQYSGNTKVGERRVENRIDADYDTTAKQYPILKDAKTGFTYEYVGLKQGSPAASGKVVAGITEVIYEYRLVSEEEKTPSSSRVTKTGSVDVKHVVINEDGTLKTLKSEIIKDKVPVEYEDTYVTYSNGVKVSERKATRIVTEKYNATDKQYPILKDEASGLLYKYVGPIADSVPAEGDVTEGEKHVIYSYVLDKKEDTIPKDKKGTVIVKFIDINEVSIADDKVVKDNVIVEKATTTISGGKEETTYKATGEEYAVAPPQTIEVDGLTFKLNHIVPVSDKWNNSTVEKGLVKEGVTTIVYQYVLQLKKAPEVEVPEYTGGAMLLEPPTVEVPEYKGGVVSLDPPIMEKPDYKEITVTPIPNPKPNPEPEKTDIKDETPNPKDSISTQQSKENEDPVLKPDHKQEELPQTGTEQEIAVFSAAASSILAGLGLMVPTFKKKNSDETSCL